VGPKLAIVATHPIQYYAPWFSYLSRHARVSLRVFYLWDFGVSDRIDAGFQTQVRWDIPLLDGYEHEFVPNLSRNPGTGTFWGLWNPELLARVRAYGADAVLLTAYNYASIANFLWRARHAHTPLLFRGDSHRLVPRRGGLAAVSRAIVARVFARFSAVLYVGSANRDYFRLHGVPEARLFAAPHAVDNERFFRARAGAEAEALQWRRSMSIPDDHKVILFAGKFEEKKRPLDLLEAFVESGLERTCLLFVGSGPLEGALRERAVSHPRVKFAPFQNQSLMPRTYAACDVFVLPSYGPAETWGLAVNEAMCMGRAVIVSEHVGCARDLVIPGETGITFHAGSVGALSDALREALRDASRLKRWGDNARRRIEGYSYEKATAGLLSALRYVAVPPCGAGA
jgi:glycosyltransferase involved in cell wall biosynthesis